MAESYVLIPGTQQRVYEGSVCMLFRLPHLRWIIHNGYYNYNGRKQKGWYFSSIPADTTMPVFDEDLVAMKVIDGGAHPGPGPFPPGPFPPGPFPPGPGPGPVPPGPYPPAPVPIPFTPQDKAHLDEAMLTVDDIAERDKLGSFYLPDGKVVRVNDSDGHGTIEYYSWNAAKEEWEVASLGYRYMTREEIEELNSVNLLNIVWGDELGVLTLYNVAGDTRYEQLTGIAHHPSYDENTHDIRLPIYGREDLVIHIPDDMFASSIRFEEAYEFEDHHIAPAIVVAVSDGTTTKEIAADVSGIRTMFKGSKSATAEITFDEDDGTITGEVLLSSIAHNRIQIDREGLYVDVTDLEERLTNLESKTNVGTGVSGELLSADENGNFVRSGVKVGGDELSDDPDTVAKEEAVRKAIAWQFFNH